MVQGPVTKGTVLEVKARRLALAANVVVKGTVQVFGNLRTE